MYIAAIDWLYFRRYPIKKVTCGAESSLLAAIHKTYVRLRKFNPYRYLLLMSVHADIVHFSLNPLNRRLTVLQI